MNAVHDQRDGTICSSRLGGFPGFAFRVSQTDFLALLAVN